MFIIFNGVTLILCLIGALSVCNLLIRRPVTIEESVHVTLDTKALFVSTKPIKPRRIHSQLAIIL